MITSRVGARSASRSFLRRSFPERGLQDLAGSSLRQFGDETDLARVLVRRKPLAAVGDDLGRAQLGTWPQDDDRHDLLAEALVWLADHGSLEDVRVGVEDLLDLARVDVVPTPDHQVLGPV